ncbi:MAG: class I SAM-dependent methyltransferase [Flavobacteriales bacterium]
MDPYQTTFETWDKLAELYYEKFSAIRIYDETYNLFCSLIPKEQSSVLEIGCGPGNVTRYLMDHRPDLKITGLDVAPTMIDYARKMVPEAQFDVLDIRDLHLMNGKFDGIFNGFCLPYQSKKDLQKFLLDSASLLNQNGIVYLSCIEGDYEQSGMETGSKPEYRMQVFYYSESALRKALSETGFETISVSRIAYPSADDSKQVHLIIQATKK